MLMVLLFAVIGAGLLAVALGVDLDLVELGADWMRLLFGVIGAYLVFVALRGLRRSLSGEAKPIPEQVRAKMPRIVVNSIITSLCGMVLLVLAFAAPSMNGALVLTQEGVVVLATAGAILDAVGVGILLAARTGFLTRARPGAAEAGGAKTAPEKGKVRKLVGAVLFVPLFVVLMPLIFMMVPGSCMGFEEVVLRRLNDCSRARDLLGSPIERRYVGFSCGSAEVSGSFGEASWTIPVKGPKQQGSVSFAAEKRGGPWVILNGTLSAGDQEIDLVSCEATSGVPMPNGELVLAGQVTSVIGTAPAAQNTRCEVQVKTASDKPCHVDVRCGGQLLYGGEEVGWARCWTDAKGALVVQDAEATPQSGDPILDLRVASRQLAVSDQSSSGLWAVSVTLDVAGEAPPPAAP